MTKLRQGPSNFSPLAHHFTSRIDEEMKKITLKEVKKKVEIPGGIPTILVAYLFFADYLNVMVVHDD